LRTGDSGFSQADLDPLLEIVHAIRDNLSIDLRDDAPRYFASLPLWYLASFYPAPYEAAANEFRVPSWAGTGEPDLRGAALARAAGMAMVASDPNANETQYAQGFLMQDRFIMRDKFGAPYEFLWANPYQPGTGIFAAAAGVLRCATRRALRPLLVGRGRPLVRHCGP
jgi:hypothetical protein